MMKNRTIIIWLTIYAVCMAYLEASLVVHLRSIYYPDNPVEIFPLSLLSRRDLNIELSRELATLLMILSIAVLTVREKHRQFGVFLYVFGLWDLFYYLWLKIMIGWPVYWLEWDILFLIPWPWLAPWLSAAFIAILMTAGGLRIVLSAAVCEVNRSGIVLFLLGMIISMTSFLSPALPLLVDGETAFRGYMPTDFPWVLYTIGYLLLASGLWMMIQDTRDRD